MYWSCIQKSNIHIKFGTNENFVLKLAKHIMHCLSSTQWCACCFQKILNVKTNQYWQNQIYRIDNFTANSNAPNPTLISANGGWPENLESKGRSYILQVNCAAHLNWSHAELLTLPQLTGTRIEWTLVIWSTWYIPNKHPFDFVNTTLLLSPLSPS